MRGINWYDLVPRAVAKEQLAWERRRDCVRMRALGFTLREISERLGVSKERARQLTATCAKTAPVERWQRRVPTIETILPFRPHRRMSGKGWDAHRRRQKAEQPHGLASVYETLRMMGERGPC